MTRDRYIEIMRKDGYSKKLAESMWSAIPEGMNLEHVTEKGIKRTNKALAQFLKKEEMKADL